MPTDVKEIRASGVKKYYTNSVRLKLQNAHVYNFWEASLKGREAVLSHIQGILTLTWTCPAPNLILGHTFSIHPLYNS